MAAIDLGTNTTRLLIADVQDREVRTVDRRTEITRLGEAVDRDGRLADGAVERVCEALAGFREAIDSAGAERTAAVATSAVRDAANGDEFRSLLRDRFGIEARTIPGDEEARLTFLGATAGRAGLAAPVLVIDIGGGSTELVAGNPGEAPRFSVSTPLGSVRQTERRLGADPPTDRELGAMRAEIRATVDGAMPGEVARSTRSAIAVAGTATSLAAIEQQLDPYDPERVDGYRLRLDSAERMLGMLASLPLSERREVTGLHPGRAPTIVAGAAILVEALSALGLGETLVSEADILHGIALEAANGRK